MPFADLEPTRRALLAGAAAALLGGAVSACDLDAGDPSGDSAAGGSDAPAATPPPGAPVPDTDAALLGATVQDLDTAAALVGATSLAHPVLAPVLAPLATTHTRHREVLLGATGSSEAQPGTPAVPRVRRRAAAALADVRRAEAARARRLSDAALDAQSGAFARLLAVLGASTAQHLAVLPDRPPGEPPA